MDIPGTVTFSTNKIPAFKEPEGDFASPLSNLFWCQSHKQGQSQPLSVGLAVEAGVRFCSGRDMEASHLRRE